MTNALAFAPDDRRSARSELSMVATIEAGPTLTVPVTVLNVSAHGVMACVATQLVPGRAVALTLRGLHARAGRIAWYRDGHVGIAFAEMLTIDELIDVLTD